MHTTYKRKIKEENLPKLSAYRIWRKSLRIQERVRLIHGKRAIGVRAIEVLLYDDLLQMSKESLLRNTLSAAGTFVFIKKIVMTIIKH